MTDANTGSTRPRRESPHTRLRAARLARGLSQAELAVLAGLSPGWISLLERTPELMTSRAAQRLAAVLGVSEQELRPGDRSTSTCRQVGEATPPSPNSPAGSR